MIHNKLTEEEIKVIINKETEYPFSGKFWDYHKNGIYTCRQCNAKLFSSSAKFDSGTGWPSFDESFKDAVTEVPDIDGRRIEIICTNCSGHLGHIFKGEMMTNNNIRYCVNSISLDFISKEL